MKIIHKSFTFRLLSDKNPDADTLFLMKHFLLACALFLSLTAQAHAEQTVPTDKADPAPLAWPASMSLAPIPLAEQGLPSGKQRRPHSGGGISDSKDNLLFCDVTRREVLRLDADKKTSVLAALTQWLPGALPCTRMDAFSSQPST